MLFRSVHAAGAGKCPVEIEVRPSEPKAKKAAPRVEDDVLDHDEIAELKTVTVDDVTDSLAEAFPGSSLEKEND